MTENEIILEKQIADDLSAVLKEAKAMGCREVACFRHIPLQNVEAVIQALEEIQQYRAIGALEEIKKVISFLSNDNDNSVIDDMNVLNAYRSIGTIEELQALKEKAEPKKPILRKDGTYDCVCGNIVTKTECYCEDCGQKLDWSVEE